MDDLQDIAVTRKSKSFFNKVFHNQKIRAFW